MATKKIGTKAMAGGGASLASSPIEEMLLAALERGDDTLETGRYLVTFKEGAAEEGMQSLGAQGMRVADAREFTDQAVTLENVGDADAVAFPEIGVALVGGDAAQARGMSVQMEAATDSAIESIDPEYFMFPANSPAEYLHGFLRAAETIAKDLLEGGGGPAQAGTEVDAQVLGATWGLIACKVPPSLRSGVGIKVAVLDTGFDLGHPDFAGRSITGQTFVGQPVQDLNGHGTHTTGTATGPKAPAGSTPRYGIGFRTSIFSGKVLTNSGTGSQAAVLAGMNWAIANRCPVISMSLGAQIGVQASYTAAGQAALNNGCLIIAAAGNAASSTGAPGNSPTIMSVASLDQNLSPSSFSNFGKVEIAGPGRDVFSSWFRPIKYKTISGTSMATPHVAGCAALWAETSAALRGINLWRKLQASAKHLAFPATRVGAGLVQAP
jgi:subtilisin family serine protease